MNPRLACVSLGCAALACGNGHPPETPSAKGSISGSGRAARPAVTSTAPSEPGRAVTDAQNLPCLEKARDVEGDTGVSRVVRCPGGCIENTGKVWGTDLYTDDSAVCPALVHAGVLPPKGGTASITFVRGLPAYVGSERHGIASQSYGSWDRSFHGQGLGDDGQPATPPPEVPVEGTARVDCSHRGDVAGGEPGSTLTIECPAGCDAKGSRVWGSNPYTTDSYACAAAIHAGVIPAGGGRAVLTIGKGRESYEASLRHGIDAQAYGSYDASFTVASPK